MSAVPKEHSANVKVVKENTNTIRVESEKKVNAEKKDDTDNKDNNDQNSYKKDNADKKTKADNKVDTDKKVNADNQDNVYDKDINKENKAPETEKDQGNAANEVDLKDEDCFVKDLIADLSATKVALNHEKSTWTQATQTLFSCKEKNEEKAKLYRPMNKQKLDLLREDWKTVEEEYYDTNNSTLSTQEYQQSKDEREKILITKELEELKLKIEQEKAKMVKDKELPKVNVKDMRAKIEKQKAYFRKECLKSKKLSKKLEITLNMLMRKGDQASSICQSIGSLKKRGNTVEKMIGVYEKELEVMKTERKKKLSVSPSVKQETPEIKEKHTELKLNFLQESHDQALEGARKELFELGNTLRESEEHQKNEQSLDDLVSELEEVRVSLRQERSQLLQRIEKQREEFNQEKREIVESINELRNKQQQLKKA